MAEAAAPGQDNVLFDPALQGGAITLVNENVLADADGVTLDRWPRDSTA